MKKNPLPLSENIYSSVKPNENHASSLFDFINQIKTDNISNSILLKDLNISYSQAQSLSGFKLDSFSSKELYIDFYKKINWIESINIKDLPNNSYNLLRIMILISLLSINNEARNAPDLDLKLKKINNEEIKQEEIELANQIRNINKVVDLINEGWIINLINYEQNDVKAGIESISFTKGSENFLISPKNTKYQSTLTLHQPFQHSIKALAPSSPHSNQHSMNRQKRQSTRQFDRTDYSNESSNYNEDYDYYTDDDDELLKDTFLTDQNESRLSLSRRTNSEPFIDIDPMLIFGNDKNTNSSNTTIQDHNQENTNKDEEIKIQSDNDELDIYYVKPKIERKKNNNNNTKEYPNKSNNFSNNDQKSCPKRNTKINNDIEVDNYSYSSNSSDFDYNYYSSGEEEITTTSSRTNKENFRNYSNERRRHRHRHHHISKQIKNKIELRKLEESPRRTTQLYIDEFDDVRKLYSSHNKQQQNFQTNDSPHKICKNNNKRDFEDDFNDSDDSDENEVPPQIHPGSIRPSFSSPSNINLTFPYDLIDFTDKKSNFNEINDQELDDEDGNQSTLQINLNINLNFNSKTIQKKKKPQTFLNIDEEEDEEDEEISPKINKNKNKSNSINDLVEINDFIYDNEDDNDNENSSSDSNEDFDDLICIKRSKNNNKSSSNENFLFETNDVENGDDEKILPMINDDIYCSEPFPSGNGKQNDNTLLSPNHWKPSRSSKKRLSNNS